MSITCSDLTVNSLPVATPLWVIHSQYKKYKIVTNADGYYDEDTHLLDEDGSNWVNTSSRGNYVRGLLTNDIIDINTRVFNGGWGITYRNSGTTLSYAITVDLESSLTIERMVIGGQLTGSSGVDRPTGVKLEHSSDDASWTTLVDKTSLTNAGLSVDYATWRAMFSFSATTDRYWRITLATNANKWVSVHMLQLWGKSEALTLPMGL